MSSNNKYSACEKILSPSFSNNFKEFSEEQKNTYCAMHELKHVQQNKYGIGKTFCLQTTVDKECKTVTVTKTIGQGGFKKAALLDDGTVLMFPNVDNKSLEEMSFAWTITVDNEANTAKFLEEIDVPGLNRKKAYLVVKNNEESYELPVLHSNSFAQYKEKGWFIRDNKNPQSSFVSNKEKGHWEYNLKVWEEPIKPLVRDVATMLLNGLDQMTGDCGNIVLKENDNGKFEFHYFGFDFNGATGMFDTVPSAARRTEFQKYSVTNLCAKIAEESKVLISDIVYHSLYSLDLGKEDKKSLSDIQKFSDEVGKHFLTCDFIEKVMGETSYQYNSDEL